MNEEYRGLDLGEEALATVSETEAEEIHRQWDMYPQVLGYLEQEIALVAPKEPDFACPPLQVGDLTTNDSNKYTETYVQRVSWFGFYSEKKAEHDAVVLGIEAEMNDIETRLRNLMRKNNQNKTRAGEAKMPSAQTMEDKINSDPRYIDLKQKLVYHRQILKRLNARVETLDRELKLTSRQVEIRRQESDMLNARPGIRHPSPGMTPPRRFG